MTKDLIMTGAIVFLITFILLGITNPKIVRDKKDECKCAPSTLKTALWALGPAAAWILVYKMVYLKQPTKRS